MPQFACVQCGTLLSAGDAQAGKAVRCPKCKAVMRVPAPAGTGTAAAAPAREMVGAAAGGEATRPAPAPSSSPGLPAIDPVTTNPAGAGKRYGFNCQYCSSRLEANGAIAGQEGNCPTCGNTIIIPILDRYGRLIDPMTGKVIKPPPHPVHAYAAAGDRAPKILRQGGKSVIECPRCRGINEISANNCKRCGMPFTMEGTTIEAAGASNGMCTASLVLGILSLPFFCTVVLPILAIVFGLIGLSQTKDTGGSGRGLAIAGIVCGGIGLVLGGLMMAS